MLYSLSVAWKACSEVLSWLLTLGAYPGFDSKGVLLRIRSLCTILWKTMAIIFTFYLYGPATKWLGSHSFTLICHSSTYSYRLFPDIHLMLKYLLWFFYNELQPLHWLWKILENNSNTDSYSQIFILYVMQNLLHTVVKVMLNTNHSINQSGTAALL